MDTEKISHEVEERAYTATTLRSRIEEAMPGPYPSLHIVAPTSTSRCFPPSSDKVDLLLIGDESCVCISLVQLHVSLQTFATREALSLSPCSK